VNVWNHVQMHARRAALTIMVGGVVGCTAHSIPSTAFAELPLTGVSALTLNSGGTLLPDARTDGSMFLFDERTRVIRLANFDLSDPVPHDAASSGDLIAPIRTLAEFVRFRQRGSKNAAFSSPWVRALTPLTPQIQPSLESTDRTTDPLLTYYFDHAFDITEAREQSMKAKAVGTSMLADDVWRTLRQLPVESISAMTVIAPD